MAISHPTVNELIYLLSRWKGNRTTQDVCKGTGVSRETMRKIERGQPVKLSTLNRIADYFKVPSNDREKLLRACTNLRHGRDVRSITPKRDWTRSRDPQADEILNIASQLSADERKHFLLAMTRPAIRKIIPLLNSIHDARLPKRS